MQRCLRGAQPHYRPSASGSAAFIQARGPHQRGSGPTPVAPLARRCCCTAATDHAGASSSGRGAGSSRSGNGAGGSLIVSSEFGMQALAAAFAAHLRPGDVYLLYGAVGAGKSEFSRAFIRAAADDPYLTVPSPTFLLQQIYEEHEAPPIHHFDLYRLEPGSDMGRLDMGASFERAVSLVEWPERLAAGHVPQQRLEVSIDVLDEAEQRRLEEELQQDRRPTAGAANSSSGGGSSGYEASEEDDWGEAEDGDPYTDRRWRRVRLTPHGRDWEARAGKVAQAAASGELSPHVSAVSDSAVAGPTEVVR